MKLKPSDISVTKHVQFIELSCVIDNQLECHKYQGFTIREAKQDFIERYGEYPALSIDKPTKKCKE